MKKINQQTFVVEIHTIINGRGFTKYIADDTVMYPVYTNNPEYIKRYTNVVELHKHMKRIGVDCYNVVEK